MGQGAGFGSLPAQQPAAVLYVASFARLRSTSADTQGAADVTLSSSSHGIIVHSGEVSQHHQALGAKLAVTASVFVWEADSGRIYQNSQHLCFLLALLVVKNDGEMQQVFRAEYAGEENVPTCACLLSFGLSSQRSPAHAGIRPLRPER